MTRICHLLILLLNFISITTQAGYVNNRFFITEKTFDFNKSTKSGKCSGSITYPVLSSEEQELVLSINEEISDFVQIYAICNKDDHSNFSVKFDMPEPGSEDYFSIRWITKKDDKIYRIDSLNFNTNNAELMQPDDIFNPLSSSLIKEMIKISGGHLQANGKWENFLDKIGKRDIQYYLKKGEWYIVFNSTLNLEKVIDVKIPNYFLEGNDVTRAR